MNYLFIIVAIVLLGGGVFYFSTNSKDTVAEEPKTDIEKNTSEEMNYSDESSEEIDDAVIDTSVTTEGDVSVSSGDSDTAKTFTVQGTNFAYDVKEIRVQEGDTVTINFESADGFHDWALDEFKAFTDKVRPGTPTSVTFVADTAGTYEYYCSVGSHRAQGMVGTLIVE